MIRDPSDGSVKENTSKGINLQANEINEKSDKTGSKEIILETGTSGLPKHKREELKRLNESREWLKQWTHRKVENDER